MPTSSQFKILTSLDDVETSSPTAMSDPNVLVDYNAPPVRNVSLTGSGKSSSPKSSSNRRKEGVSPLTTVHLHVDRATLPNSTRTSPPSPRSALRQEGQRSPKVKRVSFCIPDANSQPQEVELDALPELESPHRRLVELGFRVTDLPRSDDRETESVSTSGDGGQLPGYLKGRKGIKTAKHSPLTSISTEDEPPRPISPVEIEQSDHVDKVSPTATITSLRAKLRSMAPVRVRMEPPGSEPLKVCVHCRGSLISHSELKKIAEDKIHYFRGVKVTYLQFDPLAAWVGDPEALSRWIISLSDADACHYLKRTGLNINGQYYSVEGYDDILMDEYNVYRMKQEILNDRKRKTSKLH